MKLIKDNHKAIIKIILNNKISTNLTKKKSNQIKIPNNLKIHTKTTLKIKANINNNLYKIQQLTKKNIKMIYKKQVSLKNHSKMVHLTVSYQEFQLIQIWDNIN
jgi:hypothetical protein